MSLSVDGVLGGMRGSWNFRGDGILKKKKKKKSGQSKIKTNERWNEKMKKNEEKENHRKW